MSSSIVVLKFGSSVLTGEAALPAAVLEIYREVRRNRRVVAVVSAFGETTDSLLGDAHRLSDQPDPRAVARLLATGEARAAASLGLALGEVGLPHEVLDAGQIGLLTTGPVQDAEPAALDSDRLQTVLAAVPVVVVPGFCGVDERGRTTLLGRGGSDLTALFVAKELGAVECRLLKDVDGLLRVAPDGVLDFGTRYATAHYDECLRVGGPLIQPKAVEFATRHGLEFTIARCGSSSGTLAGSVASRFEAVPPEPPRLKVALAGLGTVGLGVLRWLRGLGQDLELTGILVSDRDRTRHDDVPRELLTDNWRDLLSPQPDLVIEVIGGTGVAAELISAARGRGIAVVTANKELLAQKPALGRAAVTRQWPPLRAAASVGGGVPALEHAALIAADNPVQSLTGVLNGTCNFVLERLQAGDTYTAAITAAQQLGFAEADPHLDVSGLDSVYKLSLLCTTLFGTGLPPAAIECRGLETVTPEQVQAAGRQGQVLKLVAVAERHGSRVRGRVSVQALAPDDPLARGRNAENCLFIHHSDGRTHALRGKGAGRYPTTCSVLADVMEIRREILDAQAEGAARMTG